MNCTAGLRNATLRRLAIANGPMCVIYGPAGNRSRLVFIYHVMWAGTGFLLNRQKKIPLPDDIKMRFHQYQLPQAFSTPITFGSRRSQSVATRFVSRSCVETGTWQGKPSSIPWKRTCHAGIVAHWLLVHIQDVQLPYVVTTLVF